MAKFSFRLETLLRLRLAERDTCRHALADLISRDQALEHRVAQIDAELRILAQEVAERSSVAHVARRIEFERYANAQRAERAQCEEKRAALAEQIAIQREALLAADQEVRSLERLREEQQAAFQADQQRREQRELDDIALRGHLAQHEL
jgi:flagellar FliJ protein